jgi:hypothetical protein
MDGGRVTDSQTRHRDTNNVTTMPSPKQYDRIAAHGQRCQCWTDREDSQLAGRVAVGYGGKGPACTTCQRCTDSPRWGRHGPSQPTQTTCLRTRNLTPRRPHRPSAQPGTCVQRRNSGTTTTNANDHPVSCCGVVNERRAMSGATVHHTAHLHIGGNTKQAHNFPPDVPVFPGRANRDGRRVRGKDRGEVADQHLSLHPRIHSRLRGGDTHWYACAHDGETGTSLGLISSSSNRPLPRVTSAAQQGPTPPSPACNSCIKGLEQ